jgi:hypothetical protein
MHPRFAAKWEPRRFLELALSKPPVVFSAWWNQVSLYSGEISDLTDGKRCRRTTQCSRRKSNWVRCLILAAAAPVMAEGTSSACLRGHGSPHVLHDCYKKRDRSSAKVMVGVLIQTGITP